MGSGWMRPAQVTSWPRRRRWRLGQRQLELRSIRPAGLTRERDCTGRGVGLAKSAGCSACYFAGACSAAGFPRRVNGVSFRFSCLVLVLMQTGASNSGASYLAPELCGGVASVKSGLTNPCRIRETGRFLASKVCVRP